jgi:hypothetical protein
MSLQGTIAEAQPESNIKTTETTRPFKVHISDVAIKDLRKRISDTRWPDKETVTDQSQGVNLSKLQGLANYWTKNYSWRKAEATLNAYPQFMTTIDGIDIHFIHVRSKEPNAMPIIISHGWPDSVIELLKIIDPLSNDITSTRCGLQPG